MNYYYFKKEWRYFKKNYSQNVSIKLLVDKNINWIIFIINVLHSVKVGTRGSKPNSSTGMTNSANFPS